MKVYITRDEKDDWIWLWLKPAKGPLIPVKIPDCDMVFWHRPGTSVTRETDAYLASDFKKKFGTTIREKTRKLVNLPEDLVNSEDYKLFSPNKDRKK